MTAAIDAKDQYTCGHSDRVARIAVRLAQELGCDAPTLNTIYLAGLLHDIGKIGIADSVLRKPGKLSDEEYRHIKTHPEIGHRILHDLQETGQHLAGDPAPSRGVGRRAAIRCSFKRRDSPGSPNRRRCRLLRRHGQRPPLSQRDVRRKDRRDFPRGVGRAMGPRGGGRLLPRPRRPAAIVDEERTDAAFELPPRAAGPLSLRERAGVRGNCQRIVYSEFPSP